MMSNEQELERLIGDLQLTTSAELDERILADASGRLSRNNTRVETEAALAETRPRQTASAAVDVASQPHLWRRLVPSFTAVALILAVGAWWFSRPANSWAQVVEAVQEKPWIHMIATTPDGRTVEEWFSIKHQVSAGRSASRITFRDFQAGRSEYFDRTSKEIVRSDADGQSSDRRNFDAFTSLLHGLLQGDVKLDVEKAFGHMPDVGEIEQSRREVKTDNGWWYDYDLTLHPKDEKPSKITIRVDAASMLPQAMTMVNGEEGVSKTFRFEFPDSGPENIYALGVPRDAKIVNHSLQGLGEEMKAIVDGIRIGAEKFDDYRAIAVISTEDLPWHVGTPMLIWRKGERTRLEIGSVDPDNPPSSEPRNDQTDQASWWKERCRLLWFSPVAVSDGKTLFQNEFTPQGFKPGSFTYDRPLVRSPTEWGKTDWKNKPAPRHWPVATPPIISAYPYDLSKYVKVSHNHPEVISDPPDAPSGTILVKAYLTSGGVNSEIEYLVDPGRSYMVLRDSSSSFTEENGRRIIQYSGHQTHEDLKQSPKGFWYPSLLRSENTQFQDGKPNTTTSVGRYYLDFDVEIPDDLFRPREREGRGFPE